MEYKFRAECMMDVLDFICRLYQKTNRWNKIDIENVSLPNFPVPDVVVTLESSQSLSAVRELLSEVEDGHVMVESLNYADKYNGDRWWRG